MKKIALAAVAALGLLAACSTNPLEDGYQPGEFISKVECVDIDIARAVAKRYGLPLEAYLDFADIAFLCLPDGQVAAAENVTVVTTIDGVVQ